MDVNWYLMQKVGNQLVNERLQIAKEEREIWSSKRHWQREDSGRPIIAALVALISGFGHRRGR